MTKRKDPADFAQDSRSPFAMTGRICARRPGAAVRNGEGGVMDLHCCDDCIRAAGIRPKTPADSGVRSLPCAICGHYGIGSAMPTDRGQWGCLKITARKGEEA